MQINHKLATPYHPQTNGSLERTHLSLKDYFRCYVNKDQNNWDEFLNLATYSYNTNIHKSTQKTPYELVFGQTPRIPNIINKPITKPNYSDFARDITNKLQIIRSTARENLIKSKEKSKRYYDKTHNRTYEFRENQLILLYDRRAKNTSKRLSKNFKGPYKIVQIHDNQTATIEIATNNLKTYHFNELKPYHLSENEDEENNGDITNPILDANNHNTGRDSPQAGPSHRE